METCVFCKIINHGPPAVFVFKSEEVVAFYSPNPVTEGHILVVPKRHVRNFMEDPLVTGATASVAAELAGFWQGYEDANLITSAGESATQTIPHLHFHIVPRHENDGLKLPWSV